MKQVKQLFLNFGIGFVCLNLFGWAFLRGESFPPPPMQDKLVYVVRVPAPSPLIP
jgi:hypothetical protein